MLVFRFCLERLMPYFKILPTSFWNAYCKWLFTNLQCGAIKEDKLTWKIVKCRVKHVAQICTINLFSLLSFVCNFFFRGLFCLLAVLHACQGSFFYDELYMLSLIIWHMPLTAYLNQSRTFFRNYLNDQAYMQWEC